MAYIDSLTDVYNRRYLGNMLASWVDKGFAFTGVMLDIDNFKGINDSYGHSEGDKALKDVADLLLQSRKSSEWVFRFAGDEFIVLKRADSLDGLEAYMDEVDKNLDEYNRGDRPYKVVLSYGMSRFEAGSIDDFMRDIDARMYEMKAEHHKNA